MKLLETRIPPPVVGQATAIIMWWVARWLPGLTITWGSAPAFERLLPLGDALSLRAWLAIALAFIGIAIDLSGLIAFRRARTTLNPMRPAATSALVTSGIYRFTRNPMYVGMALMLAGWGVWLGHPLAVAAIMLFVAYITRFQIQPEERLLAERFGPRFDHYRRQVRRWL